MQRSLKKGDVPHVWSESESQVNYLVVFWACVDCVGFVSSLLNKLLKYGFVGCLYLLLKFVQVQITGSETLGGPREPHSNRAKQV